MAVDLLGWLAREVEAGALVAVVTAAITLVLLLLAGISKLTKDILLYRRLGAEA